MSIKRYASDLTDEEWEIVEPLVPMAKEGGRPRTVAIREVLNGMFYLLKTGCQQSNCILMTHLTQQTESAGTHVRERKQNAKQRCKVWL